MSKVIDSIWFGTIGIVKIQPEVGPVKMYVGFGDGHDEGVDAERIAKMGMPFVLPHNRIPTGEQ